MALASNAAVKFVYITGSELPTTTDEATVYFVAGAHQLYVGSTLIADQIDLLPKLK